MIRRRSARTLPAQLRALLHGVVVRYHVRRLQPLKEPAGGPALDLDGVTDWPPPDVSEG